MTAPPDCVVSRAARPGAALVPKRLARVIAGGVLAVQIAQPQAARQTSNTPAETTQERRPNGGDAVNGRALIEANACFACHRIGDTGSRVGPDLSEIGRLRSPEQLQRSLLAPDAEVLPEHRFVRVVTNDGVVSVGRLLNQDAFSIQLIDKDEQLKSYLKSTLREHTILVKGLMPSYDGKLSTQQIADIVAYLIGLKGAGK